MKILLVVKRLESSFFAFKRSIDRFLRIQERFIDIFENKGSVYQSKGYIDRVFDLVEESDKEEELERLLEEG